MLIFLLRSFLLEDFKLLSPLLEREDRKDLTRKLTLENLNLINSFEHINISFDNDKNFEFFQKKKIELSRDKLMEFSHGKDFKSYTCFFLT